MVKVVMQLFKTLKNFVYLDDNDSLFSCKMYSFCLIGLCKGQHSRSFKMYQVSTILSSLISAILLFCNFFIDFKKKTSKEIINDCEFMVYSSFVVLKVFLLFLKMKKVKDFIESLSDKSFGWDKMKYLEMRRRNYARNLYLVIMLAIFVICGSISFFAWPLFNRDQFPMKVTIHVNFDAYPGLFSVVYIFICLIFGLFIFLTTQLHNLSGFLFSYLSNEFKILGERYTIVFDGLEDNIYNDKHERVDEIERTLKENDIQHQKLLK